MNREVKSAPAQSALSFAYVQLRQSKRENEQLRRELDQLRAQASGGARPGPIAPALELQEAA